MKGVVVALIASVFTASAYAVPEGLGVGGIVGEPTGLDFKKWRDEKTSVDAAIAWSFFENDSLQLHADYLIHRGAPERRHAGPGGSPFYYGLGVRWKLSNDVGSGRNVEDNLIGVRAPLGMSVFLEDRPVDLFAEVVPVLDISPDTEFDLNAAAGARVYFE